MVLEEVLIGRGRTGRVKRVSEDLVRKEFSQTYFARSWNWFFFKSLHPLSTELGVMHAYWKRRFAHRLNKVIDNDVSIVDAVAYAGNGIILPFVDGSIPARGEMGIIYHKARHLEQTFDAIGMPTLSFSPRHVNTRRKNFMKGKDGLIHIVDYEQSVPMPDTRGQMGYDAIYFEDVSRFLRDKRIEIADKLGTEEAKYLDEAFELSKLYQEQLDLRPRIVTKIQEKFSKPLSIYELDRAVEKLHKEGHITPEELEAYKSGKTGEHIRLARSNLLVHGAISLVTPPYIASLHSAAARLAWTVANWGYYTLNRDYDRRKIHNWRVMAVSGLPLGIFGLPISLIPAGAYLLSIMEENPKIGLAINDNLVREFMGKTLEEFMGDLGSKPIIKQGVLAYDWGNRILSHVPGIGHRNALLGSNITQAHDILLSYAMKGATK